jgi:hypothetical protein
LVCTFCEGQISPTLEYTPRPYSEHRDHTGYECDNFRCGAEWDAAGRNTVPSMLISSPAVTDADTAQPSENRRYGSVEEDA